MADFHQQFRNQVRVLQEQIDSLSAPDLAPAERRAKTETSLAGITELSAELADAAGDLPSYDQRRYNEAIKELQEKLAITQASHGPKAKFSFKNKRLAPPSSEVNSATTSRSVTPSHLRASSGDRRGYQPTPALASPPHHNDAGPDQDQDMRDPGLTPEDGDANNASNAHVAKTHISMYGASNAYLRFPSPAQQGSRQEYVPNGLSCIISEISSSIVQILPDPNFPSPPLLTINNVVDSLLLPLDVRGPAHITNLQNSVIVLSCHQFRMHRSHNVDVYLHCASRPIIEDCSNISFSVVPTTFQPSGGEPQRPNMFDQVDDFKWLRAEPSPNWSLMKEDRRVKDEKWERILERLQKLDPTLRSEALGSEVQDLLAMIEIGRRKPD